MVKNIILVFAVIVVVGGVALVGMQFFNNPSTSVDKDAHGNIDDESLDDLNEILNNIKENGNNADNKSAESPFACEDLTIPELPPEGVPMSVVQRDTFRQAESEAVFRTIEDELRKNAYHVDLTGGPKSHLSSLQSAGWDIHRTEGPLGVIEYTGIKDNEWVTLAWIDNGNNTFLTHGTSLSDMNDKISWLQNYEVRNIDISDAFDRITFELTNDDRVYGGEIATQFGNLCEDIGSTLDDRIDVNNIEKELQVGIDLGVNRFSFDCEGPAFDAPPFSPYIHGDLDGLTITDFTVEFGSNCNVRE